MFHLGPQKRSKMNFTIHAKNSANKHKGKPEDYFFIHSFLDAAKDLLPTTKHRLFLHNTLGIHLCVKAFGETFVNSDGVIVSVAEIARQHIIEDLGVIPTIEEVTNHLDKSQVALFNSRILGELIKHKRKEEREAA